MRREPSRASAVDDVTTIEHVTIEVLEQLKEELVNYEASLEHFELPYDPTTEVVMDFKEEKEEVL